MQHNRNVFYKLVGDDEYVRITNRLALERWIRRGGWSSDQFQELFGNPDRFVNVWFCIVHDRVYILDDNYQF